jgi:DNA-binding transcriptional MerR regulator
VARDQRTWGIAELADELGVTHRTLRWYEQQGLVRPERRGTQRVFHPRDRVRLELVLRGRRLGFALDEIRTIIDMYDESPGEEGQLRYLLGQIAARRAELEQRRTDLDRTLAELDDVEARCRRDLRAIEALAAGSRATGAATLGSGSGSGRGHADGEREG